MNILFVNYGDFTSNSLNHIAGFAAGLAGRSHACAVAVPQGKDTLSVIPDARFRAAAYEEALADPASLFPDGRPADLLHAWTPREAVRKFVVAYQRRTTARLIVHLEDNEEFLTECLLNQSIAELRRPSGPPHSGEIPDLLSHPVRYRNLLRLADGATVIVETLARFVPSHVPVATLPPGVDFSLYRPQPPDPSLRARLGLSASEKILVFTGGNSPANEPELRELYRAVHLLNQRGTPTRLVRTGLNSIRFLQNLDFDPRPFIIDLGFVDKLRLPGLLALADVLVQPGRPGPFNDYRLPSKIPEFLAMGKPVVLPAANVGVALQDGRDALVLREGAAEEIAGACARLFADAALSSQLGQGGLTFARAHFDPAANTARLADFYAATLARTTASPWLAIKNSSSLSDFSLLADHLRARIAEAGDHPSASGELADAATDLALLCRRLEADADVAREAERLALELDHIRELGRATVDDALREIIRLRDLLYQREEKIRDMQASFSWRTTAVFRALRRRLIDRFRRKKIRPPDPSRFPAFDFPRSSADFQDPSPHLRYGIDEPRAPWRTLNGAVRVSGWCYATNRLRINAIRARIGDRIFPGIYGQPHSAGSLSNASPLAQKCGFVIDLTIDAKDRLAVIEIGDTAGNWHRLFTRHVGQGVAAMDYARWVREYDTLTPETTAALRGRVQALRRRPLISVLMPVYNAPEKFLLRAIDSVRAQIYENWELCIADDASTAPHIRPLLEKAGREDSRIKVVLREKNGHISAASNSALELAQGEFVALLDHDDELRPHALACVAFELDRFPGANLIYSDEDKIGETDFRYGPYFKPDWNPDLLLAQNFICHLGVYRTALVRELGGFRTGCEGSQDWDLALRVSERTPPEQIRHIPRVLYHWRAVPGSTAMQISEKNYSVAAAKKAIADHFSRMGLQAGLTPTEGHYWRVHYPRPDPAPRVTLAIPTRNRVNFLRPCLDSILQKTTYSNYEILVVDNDSDEPETVAYLDELRRQARCRVVSFPGAFNFSAINNFAIRQTDSPLIGLLNNDLEVINADWLDEMASQALRPEIGCVGAKLYYPDGRIQHAGVILGLGREAAGHAWHGYPGETRGQGYRALLQQNLSAVTAACLVIRREVYLQVGGFDEENFRVALNDVDFCLKVRAAGYRNLYTPFAELYHYESASRGYEDTPEKRERFLREAERLRQKWGDLLFNDPAYNPNLTLDRPDFGLAFPPRVPALDQADRT